MPVERSNFRELPPVSGSVPSGAHPRGGVARDLQHLHHALADRSAHVFRGVLEHRSVEPARRRRRPGRGRSAPADRRRTASPRPRRWRRSAALPRAPTSRAAWASRSGVAPGEEHVGALAADAARVRSRGRFPRCRRDTTTVWPSSAGSREGMAEVASVVMALRSFVRHDRYPEVTITAITA